jgi:hypothetical protein
MMDKRGQGGLSMNTIVVAIVAIIVLLLIVTFFTGGLGTIGQKITNVFETGTVGYDVDLAVKNCNDFCARAQKLPTDSLKEASPYCKQGFDTDGDPETEKISCKDLGITCPEVSTLLGC